MHELFFRIRMLQLSDLRVKLDQATGRITSRLKDRSRFPLNNPVYVPDAIPIKGGSGISLFEYALAGLERYHASLGRYKYPDQFPVIIEGRKRSATERYVPPSPITTVRIDIRGDLTSFYTGFLRELCDNKDEDPLSFGETAYCDADLIELTHERINLGRYVAESKLQSDPSVQAVVSSADSLAQKLRDMGREEKVVARTREVAERYELSPSAAEKYMRWIIDETLKVEVEYLQRKFALP